MPEKLHTLEDLFVDLMKDIYSAENQLIKALPRMAKAATAPDLKRGFEEHLEVTKGQVARIEEIFADRKDSPRGKRCVGMEGLIEEGKEIIDADATPEVRDAGLIAAAQKVEHYEISSYGTVRAIAAQLGFNRAVELLQQTLDEEAKTDERLTKLAESGINAQAQQ
jgi:ferritin-like metal-binding protein YciE